MMKVKIKKLHPDAVVPTYATEGSACFDLCAVDCGDQHPLYYHEGHTFRTGLAFEIPAGHVLLVFSRSGHGFNNGTRLANSVGVIDSDYRGELKVRLFADSPKRDVLRINPGDRIAQAMILPVQQVDFDVVDDLSETERGTGGFGSTGS